MNESSRFKDSDVEVIINNEEALATRLEEAWVIVDKYKIELAELKAQVKILKEVISELRSDY